jgi:hypothetical protein
VKRWSRILDKEVGEYQGPAQQLSNMLVANLSQAVAELGRMVTALDAYVALPPPPGAGALGTTASTADAPAPINVPAASAAERDVTQGSMPADNPGDDANRASSQHLETQDKG